MKKVVVIGSGFAGLSAAAFMAKAGWAVQVVEKCATPGGRARRFESGGFTFDMGPSWYWMPDVFDRFFAAFGKRREDYYQLQRLDPSYRVYWPDGAMDIPANYTALEALFESMETGAAKGLNKYLAEAGHKYRIGMQKLVYKPGQSLLEFLDWELVKNVFRLDVFTSIKTHIARHFSHPRIRQLMEFPVLFLGALPQNTPALYSLMNYADICGGTWYPQGGMYRIVEAMHALCTELGVKFAFGEEVTEVRMRNGKAREVITSAGVYEADAVISGADYAHTEQSLLPPEARTYSPQYWKERVLAPSCLIYYVGLNRKLPGVQHHSLFFDVPFEAHAREIYTEPQWPSDPLFYLSVTSATDPGAAPEGCENLFILIPVAAGLSGDAETLRASYFERVLARIEQHSGFSIKPHIVYQRSYSISDFEKDYHSLRGNAYGLANTLRQTANLRPSCRSRKVPNLFYTGQLTVPGPGVPPSLISGEVVSAEVVRHFKNADA